MVFVGITFPDAVMELGHQEGFKKRRGWILDIAGTLGEFMAKLWLFLVLTFGMVTFQYNELYI